MPVTAWQIRAEDFSSGLARDLVRLHLEGMHAHSPPGNVFALDFSGLMAPAVTVWSAWRTEEIAGIAAPRTCFNYDRLFVRNKPKFKAVRALTRVSADS